MRHGFEKQTHKRNPPKMNTRILSKLILAAEKLAALPDENDSVETLVNKANIQLMQEFKAITSLVESFSKLVITLGLTVEKVSEALTDAYKGKETLFEGIPVESATYVDKLVIQCIADIYDSCKPFAESVTVVQDKDQIISYFALVMIAGASGVLSKGLSKKYRDINNKKFEQDKEEEADKEAPAKTARYTPEQNKQLANGNAFKMINKIGESIPNVLSLFSDPKEFNAVSVKVYKLAKDKFEGVTHLLEDLNFIHDDVLAEYHVKDLNKLKSFMSVICYSVALGRLEDGIYKLMPKAQKLLKEIPNYVKEKEKEKAKETPAKEEAT